ncbi:hypothetical protein [Sphingopyxis solisilvae]|uniref:hypothetical protein n=1 Tax=Sphingopyxis solisilvae TaxID=1886788 RepID=UPI001892A162|nr:hypothetical protein [Sphingopyxis solisilvae]
MTGLAAWLLALPFAVASPAPTTAQLRELMRDLPNFATELAYEFCPQLINGETVLENNPDLIALGFAATPETGGNVDFPGFARLGQTRKDGYVAVGGISGKICEVTASGPEAAMALRQLRAGISGLGLNFEADPANSGPGDKGTVEAFQMKYSATGQVQLRLIHTTTGDGAPSASFQIIIQEK